MAEVNKQGWDRDGFLVLRNQVPAAVIDKFRRRLEFISIGDPNGLYLDGLNRAREKWLYHEIRRHPWLQELASDPSIVAPVQTLIGPVSLLEKIPLRIDLPLVVRELAVWHQDHHYVKGNTETVTAWIPLQDTGYEEGCVMVMPGSHRLGRLTHDRTVLGKRHFPSDIFDSPVWYLELKRGDLVLMHSLLLHSGNLNLSNKVRLSIQSRYSPVGLPTDPSMGKGIPL